MIEKDKRNKLYEKAIERWGYKAQMRMAEEESLEFAMAVHKDLRKTSIETSQNLIEEFADLEIMMEQVEVIYGGERFRTLVEIEKLKKLKRLKNRLGITNI